MATESMAAAVVTPAATVPFSERSPRPRISSLDIVRGVVVVLMAIDHVRVYSGLPAGGPTWDIFFTRWVTHFVAPGFAFLAGTGAFLYGRKVADRTKLAKFLVSRGAFLILLEMTVIRVFWTFNFDFQHYLLAGVIWMLGWCMILLAGLLWMPLPALTAFGLAIVFLHNLTDYWRPVLIPMLQASRWAWFWQILYFGGSIQPNAKWPDFEVLYSLVPWVGVMACGYAFGSVMLLPAERRRRYCLTIGAAAVLLFLVLRGIDVYGDPRPWNHAPKRIAVAGAPAQPVQGPPRGMNPVLRFLNTNKYPASLLFLLMTLGPLLLAIPVAERMTGPVGRVLETFGRVPMFYYLLHIPLIHLLAIAVAGVRTPSAMWWLFTNHPMLPPEPPAGYLWPFWLLYLVWAIAITLLYFACRWYAGVKGRSRSKWLSYL